MGDRTRADQAKLGNELLTVVKSTSIFHDLSWGAL